MQNKNRVTIGLLSMTVLCTELFWTRLFSAEFFYTFAFLILSLAVLNLGLGALFFKLRPRWNKPELLPIWLLLTGVLFLVSVPLVFQLNLDFTQLFSDALAGLKLLAAVLLLGSGNFFAGIAIAQLMKNNIDDMPCLYRSDLLGAAIGVVAFFLVMNTCGALTALLFCSLPVLVACLLTIERPKKWLPISVGVLAIIYYAGTGSLPEQKREERAPVIYKHWDATAKLKIFQYDSLSWGINIDNVANSPVYGFDGNWQKPDSLLPQFAIDVSFLLKKFAHPCFLSLGAGGGGDVLQALKYNAAEIHAVEVIPQINELMQEGFCRNFSGNIYNDPRVKVVTADARSYIRQFENKFDVIYSLSSNSWAALASGSFALAENYLFTTEAFMDYWRALSDRGYLSIEHQFYAPRLLAELTDALGRLKIPNPESHFAVYNLPSMRRKLLLVSKQPLDEATLQNAYGTLTPESASSIHLLYPAPASAPINIYTSIINNGWQEVADTSRVNISACTDDRPFIAQLGLWRNLQFTKVPAYEFTGFPISKLIMVFILAICLLIVLPLNLLPFLHKGGKLAATHWLYFFSIGMAYMSIEVILLQKYALFIGASYYTIALVLLVLLVAGGMGSGHSTRNSHYVIFSVILLWLLADMFLFKHLFYWLTGWSQAARMFLCAVLLTPLGYFMGMPFPKASAFIPEQIDWAFAVNGSAAVIGSVLIMLIASSYGYSAALAVSLLLYGAALLCYQVSWHR
jgi:spermidine synthase